MREYYKDDWCTIYHGDKCKRKVVDNFVSNVPEKH